ncbi:MAG: helix-turn-helix transcriptional regulator [Betaproteobacteria bacterium]|nr:helix-turn-helix transcriptional regulator [Betaproteobacteria bacterium]
MKKLNELNLRDKQLLELLAAGLPGKDIAKKLDLSEGTTRVYLHNLYAKIGVKGRAEAMVLHNRAKAAEVRNKLETLAAGALVAPRKLDESAGDIAVRTGLLSSLGAMSCFLGPHSRAWEISVRLKGETMGDDLRRRRMDSRRLWEALLGGDWPYAKQAAENGAIADFLIASPADYAVACCMLALGGFQVAGEMIKLHEGRGGALHMLKKSESNLVQMTLASSLSKDGPASDFLRSQLKAFATNLPFKHLAMVVAYHLCLKRKDENGAVEIANALWKEAESQRQHLLEMGDDVLTGATPGSQNGSAGRRAARHLEADTAQAL